MDFYKILNICLGLLVLVREIVLYEQRDYTVKTERAIISSYNQNYCTAEIHFFKFNRTYTALSGTLLLKKDVGYDMHIIIQAYKFASNEYREFPLRFSENLCKGLQSNEFGLHGLYNCGNFTGCPLQKGTYHVCNWGPDYSKFPPYIPHGQFKFEMEFHHGSDIFFTAEWYVKVEGTRLF